MDRKARDDQKGAEHILYRQRHLPAQIERARAKLARLESDCRFYGLHDLLEKKA
jgi:hypothetical protein